MVEQYEPPPPSFSFIPMKSFPSQGWAFKAARLLMWASHTVRQPLVRLARMSGWSRLRNERAEHTVHTYATRSGASRWSGVECGREWTLCASSQCKHPPLCTRLIVCQDDRRPRWAGLNVIVQQFSWPVFYNFLTSVLVGNSENIKGCSLDIHEMRDY